MTTGSTPERLTRARRHVQTRIGDDDHFLEHVLAGLDADASPGVRAASERPACGGLMPQLLVLGARNLGRVIAEHFIAQGWDATGVARSEETAAAFPGNGVVAAFRGEATPVTSRLRPRRAKSL